MPTNGLSIKPLKVKLLAERAESNRVFFFQDLFSGSVKECLKEKRRFLDLLSMPRPIPNPRLASLGEPKPVAQWPKGPSRYLLRRYSKDLLLPPKNNPHEVF